MRLHPAPGMPSTKPVHGPKLYPASNFADLIEESSSWWESLGFRPPIPSRATWPAIVRWADGHSRPIRYSDPTRGGPVLECFDEDTIETCCAWVLAEQERLATLEREHTAVISLGRSDGDLGWDLPTSTGEHEEHSPAARQLHLATEVVSRLWDRGHSEIHVVIQAYGLTAIVPDGATVHPGIVVVVMGPAYLPQGQTMTGTLQAWRDAGARTVQPYVYWGSWARGEPGDAMILDDHRLAAALCWPRWADHDPDLVPDCLHGAVPQWLTQCAPSIWALAQLRDSHPTASDVAAARADWIRRMFPGRLFEPAAVWYQLISDPAPLTRSVVRDLYRVLADAYELAQEVNLRVRLRPLVAHTRYLDLRLQWLLDPGPDTRDRLVRWLWSSVALHVYDMRILQFELDFNQGRPEDSFTQDPDGADLQALVTRRLDEIEPMPWTPEPQRMPTRWACAHEGRAAVGTLGPYWRAGTNLPGRWFVQADDDGRVTIEIEDRRWDIPFTVQLLDEHGGIQLEQDVTTWGVIEHQTVPGRTLELRIHGDGWYRLKFPALQYPGLPHAYMPDARAQRGSVGTVRGYVWVPPGVRFVGLYVRSWAKVWTDELPTRWNEGHTHDLEAGEHTIELTESTRWIAISGAHFVVLAGACPWISVRPSLGATG